MNNFSLTPQRGPNGETYIMRGDKGFCYICKLELTSLQHCRQHTQGSKHIKKEKEVTNSLVNPAFPAGNTYLTPAAGSPYPAVSIAVTSQKESNVRPYDNKGPNGEEYDVIGPGGRCFVCGVDFTSVELAKQHLAGQKHKKKAASKLLFTTSDGNALGIVSSGQTASSVENSGYIVGHIGNSVVNSGQVAGNIFSVRNSGYLTSSISSNVANLEQITGHMSSNVASSGQIAGHIATSAVLSGQTAEHVPSKNVGLYTPPSPSTGPNGEPYIMKDNRGYCYVCNVELTSPTHAKSHLSGQKHKKKCWDGIVKSSPVNRIDATLCSGASGVLMCSICDVPFSGIENAEQHFRSEKHKKKEKLLFVLPKETQEALNPEQMGLKQFYQQTVLPVPKEVEYALDPEQTMVMKVYQPPVQKAPLQSDSHLNNWVSDSAVKIDSKVINVREISGDSFLNPLTASTYAGSNSPNVPTKYSNEGVQIGAKSHMYNDMSSSVTDNSESQLKRGLSNHESAHMFFASAEGDPFEKHTTPGFNIDVVSAHSVVKSETENDHSVTDFLPRSNSLSSDIIGPMNELSKILNKDIKNEYGEQITYTSLTDNNMVPSEESSSNIAKKIQAGSERPFVAKHDSNVGAFLLTEKPLSEANAGSPVLQGQEFQQQHPLHHHHDTVQIGSNSVDIQPGAGQPILSQTQRLSVSSDSREDLKGQIAPFYFDGDTGHCYCCSVKLTSLKHANQHLFGQKHKKKMSQWELTQKLQMEDAPQTNPLQPSPAALNPQGNINAADGSYYFNGSKGFCQVCNIELTSFQHTQQHLNGKPHRRTYERHCLSQKGVTYPLNCQICRKLFTGQESARQHFTSSKHKTKAEVLNESNQVLQLVDDGRVIMKEGQVWYFCDVCKVPLNTQEQFLIHKESPKHKKELENNQSRNSSPALEVSKTILPDSVYGDLKSFKYHNGLVASNEGDRHDDVDMCAKSIEANNLQTDFEEQQTGHETERQQVLDQNRQYLTYGQTPVITQKSSVGADSSQQLNMTPFKPEASAAPVHSSSHRNSSPPLINIRGYCGDESRGPVGAAVVTSSATAGLSSTHHTNSSLFPQNQHGAVNSASSEYFSAWSHLSHSPGIPQNSQLYKDMWHSLQAGTGRNGETEWQTTSHRSNGTRGGGANTASGNTKTSNAANGHGNTSDPSSGLDKRESNSKAQDGDMVGEEDFSSEGNNFNSGSTNESFADSGNLGNMIRKPKPASQSRNRGNEKGRNVLSLDKKEIDESFDDDDDEKEGQDYNIVEDVLIPKIADLQLEASPKPMKSDKPGFRYVCLVCNKHMNTKESYDNHVKGKSHLYMLSSRPAPDRQLPPIHKTDIENIVERVCNMINKNLDISPRSYQLELMEKAMSGDCIIYLPTGTGKTLVAVLTMGLMLQENPSRPVLFLVDKVLLVMQQARYIMDHFTGVLFRRCDNDHIVERELKVKPICGGLTTKTDIPTWKHDIVVTTAAYCYNMLENGLIRWEDFSLVVLDEVHHCNKGHPYLRLMSKYHCVLPQVSRAKVLGLTASPAGKSTIEQTYIMLNSLLANLGGADVAVVEAEQDCLKRFQSPAKVLAINVPMSSKEMDFKRHLLEYFILCYSRLTLMTRSLSNDQPPCSYFLQALNNPGNKEKADIPNVKIATQLANRFIKDPEPLSEVLHEIYLATCMDESNVECRNRFDNLRLHICNLLLVIPEIGSGADIKELLKALSPSPATEEFKKMELPCEQIYQWVKNFAEDGNNDLTMFNKLVETLQNIDFIDWSDTSSRALVLVRERKLAKQYSHRLRAHPMVMDKDLKVSHIVGHGKGAKDGGMDVKKQRRVFDNHEKYHILVATSIMEEGIDIKALQLVVCMNPPSSLRALVQMRGRARKENSHFVVLCSSEEDVEKLNNLQKQEKNMQEAAKKCLEEKRRRL